MSHPFQHPEDAEGGDVAGEDAATRHPESDRHDPSMPYGDGEFDELAPGNFVDDLEGEIPEPNEPA